MGQESVEAINEANDGDSTDMSELKKNLDWTDEQRASHLAKKMFRKQMNVYLCF